MPDLLLELYSEEIPARMQRDAQENLRKLVTDRLVDAGLTYEGAKAFSTPRRLALVVHGLLAKAKDIREEKKGPRIDAPERGFVVGLGTSSAVLGGVGWYLDRRATHALGDALWWHNGALVRDDGAPHP